MLAPKNINILSILFLIFIIRYIVLQYIPNIIINGYFSIFLCFFIITYIFTENSLFSIIISMITVNLRILYRYLKDPKTLSNYNSFSNCIIFLIALISWWIIIKQFNYIHKFSYKYYNYIIVILLLINMASLQININDNNLLCYP